MYSILHRIDRQDFIVLWPLNTWEGRHLVLRALSNQPKIVELSTERQVILKIYVLRFVNYQFSKWELFRRKSGRKIKWKVNSRSEIFDSLDIPLPKACTAFSHAFTVNWFEWWMRNELSPRTTWPATIDRGEILRRSKIGKVNLLKLCSFPEIPRITVLFITRSLRRYKLTFLAEWKAPQALFNHSVSILFEWWTSTRTDSWFSELSSSEKRRNSRKWPPRCHVFSLTCASRSNPQKRHRAG